jgi:hypothetical protein
LKFTGLCSSSNQVTFFSRTNLEQIMGVEATGTNLEVEDSQAADVLNKEDVTQAGESLEGAPKVEEPTKVKEPTKVEESAKVEEPTKVEEPKTLDQVVAKASEPIPPTEKQQELQNVAGIQNNPPTLTEEKTGLPTPPVLENVALLNPKNSPAPIPVGNNGNPPQQFALNNDAGVPPTPTTTGNPLKSVPVPVAADSTVSGTDGNAPGPPSLGGLPLNSIIAGPVETAVRPPPVVEDKAGANVNSGDVKIQAGLEVAQPPAEGGTLRVVPLPDLSGKQPDPPQVNTGIPDALSKISAGLGGVNNPKLAGAATITGQVGAAVKVGEDIANGKNLAESVKALGVAVGQGTDVNAAVAVAEVVGGSKSLFNAKDALSVTADVAKAIGGIDGQNISEAAVALNAAGQTLASGTTSVAGQKNLGNTVAAIGDLFELPKLSEGATVVNAGVDVLNGGANLGSVAQLATGALKFAGATGPVIDTLATVANVITNPIGSAIGFFLGGLNDALTRTPNESKLADVYGAVQGPGGNLGIIRAGETDAAQGNFGIKISQLNTDKISADQLGPSTLKEGEFLTNGNTRATLTDTGLLQVQQKSGEEWKPTYQAGIAVNGKNNTLLYVDQADGKSKIAVERQNADGTKAYTPIWQTDGSASVDGKSLALNISNGGVLQVGTTDQQNRREYTRSFNPGWMGIGASYNRAENGGAIAQAGTPSFETKGSYGKFDNPNQAPKVQTVDAKAGTFDVAFKDQGGTDRALVSQQRNEADTAKNSTLSFLEVQDTKYLAAAQNFSTTNVSTAADVAAGIRSGKLQDVTGKINFGSDVLQDDGLGTMTNGRGIVSALDGKEYRVYADATDASKVVRAETAKPLEYLAYQGVDASKVAVGYVQRQNVGRFGPAPLSQVDLSALNADIASGKLKEVSAFVDNKNVPSETKINVGRSTSSIVNFNRVFQTADGNFVRTLQQYAGGSD